MRKAHLQPTTIALSVLLLAVGCSSPARQNFDEGLRLFRENKMKEALPLFEQAVALDNGNAEAVAWLAETHRRLGNTDTALTLARQSLHLQPQNSFAHLVMAEALFPYGGKRAEYDTVWYHVQQAVECDSTDGNAWQMVWGKEIFENNVEGFQKVLQKMVETGFLTETALAYGRWELRHLPQHAVLLTNGDMDTFPAEAVQVTENFRPDVAVVERGLLNTPTGRRFIRDKLDVAMPYNDAELDARVEGIDESGRSRTAADHILKGWIDQKVRGAFSRPIAFASTVVESYYEEYKDHIVDAGAFLLWQPARQTATVDTATIRLSLGSIKPEDFRGPWVGRRDRSPIRRVYTKYLAKNITGTALTYARELINGGRTRDAEDILAWAEEFERATILGPTLTKEIEELRTILRRQE